jgi:hypothetical protein
MADEKVIPIKVQVENNLPEAEEKFVSLRRQIRETTVELQKLADEGKSGTKQFGDLTLKLSELKTEQEQVANKTQGLLSTFGLLGGEIGDFSDKAEIGIQSLKTLSSFTFQDIKNQFNVFAREVGGFIGKISDATGITKIYEVTNQALAKSFVAVGVSEEAAAAGAETFAGALVATGIGALIVGLGLLIANWEKVTDAIMGATEESKVFDEAQQKVTKDVADFDVKLLEVKNSLKAAEEGTKSKKEALKEYNDKLGASIGYAGSLKQAEDLLASNTSVVIESIKLKAQATIFYQKSAEALAKTVSGEGLEPGFWESTWNVIKSGGNAVGALAYNVNDYVDNVAEAKKQSEDFAKVGDELTNKSIENDKKLKQGLAEKPKDVKEKAGPTQEEKNKALQAIKDENEKARIENEDARAKELLATEKHINDLAAQAKKAGVYNKEVQRQLAEDLQLEKDKINKKYDEKESKEKRDREVKDIDDEIKTVSVLTQEGLDKIIKLRKDREAILLTNTKLTEKERKNIIDQTNKDILDDQKKFEDKKEKDRKEAEAKALKDAQAALDADIKLEQSKQKRLDNLTHAFFESQRKVEDDNYKKKLLAAKGNAEAIAAIEEEHANNMLEIDSNEISARSKLYIQYFDMTIKLAQGLQQIAEGDKETQKFAIRIQEAATIGKIVLEDLSAIRKAYNASPLTFGLPWSAFYAADAIIGVIAANQTANNAISKLDSQGSPTPINSSAASSSSNSGPITVQGHATGGYIDGPGTSKSDSIPAYLSKGEYVVNANATRAFAPLLNTMNAYGNTPKANFAMGGPSSPSDMQAQSLISAINDNLSRPIKTYVTSQDMSNQQQFHRTIKSRSLI